MARSKNTSGLRRVPFTPEQKAQLRRQEAAYKLWKDQTAMDYQNQRDLLTIATNMEKAKVAKEGHQRQAKVIMEWLFHLEMQSPDQFQDDAKDGEAELVREIHLSQLYSQWEKAQVLYCL